MDLSPVSIRAQLVEVDAFGWDAPAGHALLESLRHGVVEPIVRRSGLTGAAADQAVATGWATAWDVARRPSMRTARNPAGMVWVAVRRAVWAEVVQGWEGPGGQRARPVDTVPSPPVQHAAEGALGSHLQAIVDELVDLGWDRDLLVAAIEELADQAFTGTAGDGRARWRWVALRVGLPEWQARRLASALLGVPDHPGVLALVVDAGPGVLKDAGIHRVLRATCQRTLASPAANLSSWAKAGERPDPSRDLAAHDFEPAWEDSELAGGPTWSRSA